MTNLPKSGPLSAFAMIVDINGFGKLLKSDFPLKAQFTRDLLADGIAEVENNDGQIVGLMGDAFYALLHDPRKVVNCCMGIAKDLANAYDYFADSEGTYPFTPKNIGIKIGVEYGDLDISEIHTKFLGTQMIYTGLPVAYAVRILTAGKGNRCFIGPEAVKQGLDGWVNKRARYVKGKRGEGKYKYFVLDMDDLWTN